MNPTSCPHPDNWFDRTICPEPCGSMHTYCTECGECLDFCPYITPLTVCDEPMQGPMFVMDQVPKCVLPAGHEYRQHRSQVLNGGFTVIWPWPTDGQDHQ